MPPASARSQLIWGVVILAIGSLTGALIHAHPENLHVPAWVAYVAASAFVFSGLSLVASARGARRLQGWLAIILILAMLVPAAWIAFGPGERECSLSFWFVRSIAPDTLCRGAFGVGTVIVAAILLLAVYRALRPQSEG
jgi:cytochrome bd-type quinol oxidase subunit 1